MATNAERCRTFRQRLKARARKLVGTVCLFCKSEQYVDFAHVMVTELSKGNSRGMTKRLVDVVRNPECYRPMCRSCHRKFDLLRKLSEPVEEIPF